MSKRRLSFLALLIIASVAGVLMIFRGHDKLKQEKASRQVVIVSPSKDDASDATAEDQADLERALQDEDLLTQKELERKSFSKILDEARKALPTKEQMKKLAPADVEHDTPTAIIEAAAIIGEIKESVDHDSELSVEAAGFYLDCAKTDDVVSSIRALCLSNLLTLARGQIAIDMQGVSALPKEIIELSARIEKEQTEKN